MLVMISTSKLILFHSHSGVNFEDDDEEPEERSAFEDEEESKSAEKLKREKPQQ
jgi:hypothetical protein